MRISSWHGGLVAFGLRAGNVITPLALLVHQGFPLWACPRPLARYMRVRLGSPCGHFTRSPAAIFRPAHACITPEVTAG
ncbi:MAG TPA: hypothetical protein VN969_46715 [Streptosporangiaceae bacterium]|nr:hypothetical protein [Streptosporangiaceae bacterium]